MDMTDGIQWGSVRLGGALPQASTVLACDFRRLGSDLSPVSHDENGTLHADDAG
jgi:hypothetical protein